MKSKIHATNIHDYLDKIGAAPPPINDKELAEAHQAMIMCDSIEEAVEILQLLDTADTRPTGI